MLRSEVGCAEGNKVSKCKGIINWKVLLSTCKFNPSLRIEKWGDDGAPWKKKHSDDFMQFHWRLSIWPRTMLADLTGNLTKQRNLHNWQSYVAFQMRTAPQQFWPGFAVLQKDLKASIASPKGYHRHRGVVHLLLQISDDRSVICKGLGRGAVTYSQRMSQKDAGKTQQTQGGGRGEEQKSNVSSFIGSKGNFLYSNSGYPSRQLQGRSGKC